MQWFVQNFGDFMCAFSVPSLNTTPLNKNGIQFYGRRSIRGLKETEKDILNRVLPQVHLGEERLLGLLNSPTPLALEIGFGGGEHLAKQAMHHPHGHYIGCEPFVNGVVSLLRHIDHNQLTNISVYPLDARLLFLNLPDNCFEEVFLLFPDPWPKKRHAKRRFIQQTTIKEIWRLLKQGGVFKIATDHPLYQEWVMEQFASLEGQNLFHPIHLTFERPCYHTWPKTRYEQKALEDNRRIAYFTCKKMNFDNHQLIG
jgi:tRNA (guanine-N7-)-methyltransferase